MLIFLFVLQNCMNLEKRKENVKYFWSKDEILKKEEFQKKLQRIQINIIDYVNLML